MIDKQLVFIDLELNSREMVLDYIAEKTMNLGYVDNKTLFISETMKREEMLPTSIGYGIAIPHCRSLAVIKPFIAFLRLKNDLHWDEKNDERVNLIFLIGTPEESGSNLHLKYLSNISRKLMYEEFREKLRLSKDSEVAFNLLNQINESIGRTEI